MSQVIPTSTTYVAMESQMRLLVQGRHADSVYWRHEYQWGRSGRGAPAYKPSYTCRGSHMLIAGTYVMMIRAMMAMPMNGKEPRTACR